MLSSDERRVLVGFLYEMRNHPFMDGLREFFSKKFTVIIEKSEGADGVSLHYVTGEKDAYSDKMRELIAKVLIEEYGEDSAECSQSSIEEWLQYVGIPGLVTYYYNTVWEELPGSDLEEIASIIRDMNEGPDNDANFLGYDEDDEDEKVYLQGVATIHEELREQGKVAFIWSIHDVQVMRDDLDDEQAMRVLEQLTREYDAEHGVSYSSIESTAFNLFGEYVNPNQG